MAETVDFQVRRDDLRETRVVPLAAPEEVELTPGEVLVKIDRFAFTANNITYAVFGDGMNYWDFFPADEGWGRIPVWGFADVLRSEAEGIEAGERIYGYFPMSSWLKLAPVRTGEHGFSDGADHRAHLHAVYNSYQRLGRGHRPETEPAQMLLRPLFTTSFLIDDFLADADFFGASRVVLTSASSKSALALAHQLHVRGSVQVVGLTSPGNRDFCLGLGSYDQVLAYDDLESLGADLPTVSVDMAGNGTVLRRIHEHFGDALKHSALVGGTHWEARSGAGTMPGPEPALFFAPSQIARRMEDWGRTGYETRLESAWDDFVAAAMSWLEIRESAGPEAVRQVYLETLEGGTDPASGRILTLV
jgi:hypothetical protein